MTRDADDLTIPAPSGDEGGHAPAGEAPPAEASPTAADTAVAVALVLLQVLLSPLLLACWIERRRGGSDRWLTACAELLCLVPGPMGNLIRKAFYRVSIQGCATRAYISFGSMIVNRRASVGERAFVGPYCVIGAVRIGRDARLATRVSAMSGRHHHGSAAAGVSGEFHNAGVVDVGDGAWVGEGAIVMANVGRGAIVGAGSVVTRDVPDGAAVAGNPARPIGSQAGRDRNA
jgi:acetyltransferase-like isoleucine patch superfamily enzyme